MTPDKKQTPAAKGEPDDDYLPNESFKWRVAWWQRKKDRIAALEAELVVLRSLHPLDTRKESEWKARAAKAEADENERWKYHQRSAEEWESEATDARARVRELEAACREAKRAMDGFDPADCPHGSEKGHYDTKAQRMVDAALAVPPAPAAAPPTGGTTGTAPAPAAAKPEGHKHRPAHEPTPPLYWTYCLDCLGNYRAPPSSIPAKPEEE